MTFCRVFPTGLRRSLFGCCPGLGPGIGCRCTRYGRTTTPARPVQSRCRARLQAGVAEYVRQQLYILSSQKAGVEIIELNVQTDHVHLVMTIPPKCTVSNVIGFLKGKLSLRLFDRYPELRKKYWGQHVWSRGYCVSTVGLDEERIRKYVKWQNLRDGSEGSAQGRLFD